MTTLVSTQFHEYLRIPSYIYGQDSVLKIFVIIMYDESKHHLHDISYTIGINVIGDRRVLTDCHFVDLRIRNSTQ